MRYKNIICRGEKMDLIENIVNIEWSEFQKVKNSGERATCQDDRKSFEIGRKSQFLSWNQDMLESYYKDLINSIKQERNLINEKYARMLESTAPEEYIQIRDEFPSISIEKKSLIEDVVVQMLIWTEDYLDKYPKLKGTVRIIYTRDEKPYQTSLETYLKAELSTYSYRTLDLYFDYIKQLLEEKKNLTITIMENTVRLYGYDSLEAVENKL